MSIVRSLMWLVDRIQHREEEAKQKRWMQPFATPDPDDAPPPPSLELEDETRTYRCRFCGRVETSARYCPTCLADTMRPVRPRRTPPSDRRSDPARPRSRRSGG